MTHLEFLKRILKPKVAISENVATGNIGERIVESLSSVMQSKAWFFSSLGFAIFWMTWEIRAYN